VRIIGAIPQSIVLDSRLLPDRIPWEHLGELNEGRS